MTLYDEALALLSELIRNQCVNDYTPGSGQEIRNAATLEKFFAGENVQIQKFEPAPGRTSIAVTVPGSDPQAQPLTLLGHIDVVPIDEAQWTKPPFDAHIEDGKIYGRGSVDMLFITAAMATATRNIARKGGNKGTVTFVGVADEESRGALGARWISEHEPTAFSWENCLSETGGSHIPGADGHDSVVLYVGEKGAAQRRLHVHGDAGHGSTPYGRDSAVAKIAEVAKRIAAIKPEISNSPEWHGFVDAFRFDTKTEELVRSGTDLSPLAELAAFGDAISHLTIAQTVIRAGQAINVLPSHAWIELDIRTLPGQDDDYVDSLITKALGELADEVHIEHLISEPAMTSPTDTKLYHVLEETLLEIFPGATVVPTIAAGGSDLRFARNLGGIGYGFAVHAQQRSLGETYAQLHSHDEHLYLEDLELTVRGYDMVLHKFLY
ncbi:M20/M25/M40 family metallo-hydrolase [Corynebacterium sp. sy039]|uniref:M20/M25/M40 family metallo-hydrolase n=1 Tax=Corynebacterium sp. sy039 TaxID=2599641 RepID=UPI0011B5D43B|nr:M20/M25/M40 family metallo-hydrolase [Corynebacterium sp. sy039]QDZ41770.1 M20/M25/M40 family metallo-hydrolase [Corynebacterium sp. sy039]